MDKNKLTVLGGSTPFTVKLIDELQYQGVQLDELCLYGRNVEHLSIISHYADNKLCLSGCRITFGNDIAEALTNASIVLHQIRYGDLSGRLSDERFSTECGVLADETLGPAALRRLLMIGTPLRETCEKIRECCPQAWVINLTNPLSATTSMISENGIANCIGLCELPLSTVRQVVNTIKPHASEVYWQYCGLNHRGFITKLTVDGDDGIKSMGAKRYDSKVNNFSSELIKSLGAIPTKYFQLIRGSGAPAANRAQYLIDLKIQIINELKTDPLSTPASLEKRDMSWYRDSVVPVIGSLVGANPARHIVNIRQEDGITTELLAEIKRNNVTPLLSERCNSRPVASWIGAYRKHESAVLDMVRNPDRWNLWRALDNDPLVSNEVLDDVYGKMISDIPVKA